MLKEIKGNLFDSTAPAYGHGVNCQGKMGAGIAKEFKKRYPVMYERYALRCQTGSLKPGSAFVDRIDDSRWVANMASQNLPGAEAKLEYLDSAFRLSLMVLTSAAIFRLAIPQIGCGIGGLDWNDVKPLLADAASDYDTIVEVWIL